MKRSGLLITLLALAAVVALGGCYEPVRKGAAGPGPGGKGGSGAGKGDGSSAKPIGAALLDFIYLSEEAMRNPSCYSGPSSLIEFRRQEIEERKKQLVALIKANADSIRVVTTEISAEDCVDGLKAIAERAKKPVDDFVVEGEALKKPVLHLKTIYADDDRPADRADRSVFADEWSEMRALRGIGFRKILVAYQFYLPSGRYGYFSDWRYQTPYDRTHYPQVIARPDVSASGWLSAMKSITSSTQDFWVWLEPRIKTL